MGAVDCEEWIELGQTSLGKGNSQEALTCFNEGCYGWLSYIHINGWLSYITTSKIEYIF